MPFTKPQRPRRRDLYQIFSNASTSVGTTGAALTLDNFMAAIDRLRGIDAALRPPRLMSRENAEFYRAAGVTIPPDVIVMEPA